MKKCILFFALIGSISSYGQTSAKFTKLVPVETLNSTTKLPQNFKVVHTSTGTRATIEIQVETNAKTTTLTALHKAGRYTLDVDSLTFPKLQTEVTENGKAIEENLTVVIYLPKK